MRKSSLVKSVSLLFLIVILAACGGGGVDDVVGDDKSSSTSDNGESSGDEQVLRMHLGTDPTTFDPSLHEDFLTGSMTRQLFDGLYRLGVDGPELSLATDVDVSEDGMTYTFTLRSEEHTSELQSRGHLVCRLLLEKKKQ